MFTVPYADRQTRKWQIYEILRVANEPMSTWQVAKSLKIKPSNHLNSILKEMVGVGGVKRIEVAHRPNMVKFLFFIERD